MLMQVKHDDFYILRPGLKLYMSFSLSWKFIGIPLEVLLMNHKVKSQ